MKITYSKAQIVAQIAKLMGLQRAIDRRRTIVMRNIIKQMKTNFITLDELSKALGKRNAGSSVRATASLKSSSSKGRKITAKYKDDAGNSWSGRGRMPRWLAAAEKAGAAKEGFLV